MSIPAADASGEAPGPSSSTHPIRDRLEDALGAWAGIVWRHAWPLALVMLGLTAGLATRIPMLEIKMSTEDFLFENDPVRMAYDAFKEEFGQDQLVMLTIQPPEVFDLGFLEKLRAFHEDLEDEVPYLEEVTSLYNVRSVYGRGDELVVEDLLEEMPATEAELTAMRERVMSTPSYVNRGVISEDGRATTVLVEVATYSSSGVDIGELSGFEEDDAFGSAESIKRPFLTGPENVELIESVKRVVARHQSEEFPILAAGGTMLTYELTIAMARDVPRFFGGGLLAIAGFLVLLFRRSSPVFLCILVVVPAVISTFGLASLLGLPFSTVSQLVPSFLLAVGVGYAVHLVTIFLKGLAEGLDRRRSLEYALRHSGLPVLMTALTTTIGLLSFLVAEMKPIAEMGLISALGVVVTVVFAIVLLPALLAILPLRPGRSRETPRLDAVLGALATGSARHPWTMVIGTGVLVAGALSAMLLLRVSSDPTSWFPEDHPYRVASDVLSERFGGTSSIELLLDTGRENGLHEPAIMSRIESLDAVVADLRAGGAALSHTVSIADIAKETHQALNANDRAFYGIPQTRQLLAQELLLFENGGSDDLEKVVDPHFEKTRYTIRSTWRDGIDFLSFLDEATPIFERAVGDAGSLEVTGMSVVVSRTVGATTNSMLRSYALALTLITPLMIFLIGSLRAGLVSMVPNLVPILLTLGMMGVADIPIDMFTLLAGCIAIGLAVDDSIHFIAGFRRYLAHGNDPVQSVSLTMQSTGRALLFTSLVLTIGFLVLMGSSLLNLAQVGALTAFAIASAFLLDVTVTPALLVLTHRNWRPRPIRAMTPGAGEPAEPGNTHPAN